MIPNDLYPILDCAALHAARRFNTDPFDIEDCYDYIIEHVAPKVRDKDNTVFIRIKCQSEAHNWYASEQRHRARANYELETEDLRKNDDLTPEEQVIEREDLALIADLFRLVNLTHTEQRVIETRMGGFVTLRDVAEIENINPHKAIRASYQARRKLTPAIVAIAVEHGYDTSGQANTRKGHRTQSGWRNADMYFPRRKESKS